MSYRATRLKSLFNIDDGSRFDREADLPFAGRTSLSAQMNSRRLCARRMPRPLPGRPQECRSREAAAAASTRRERGRFRAAGRDRVLVLRRRGDSRNEGLQYLGPYGAAQILRPIGRPGKDRGGMEGQQQDRPGQDYRAQGRARLRGRHCPLVEDPQVTARPKALSPNARPPDGSGQFYLC